MIMAIDPGKSGGIVWDEDGHVRSSKMPDTEGDCVDMLRTATLAAGQERIAYIEKVGGYIAGNKCPGSSMFNFGHGRGVLVGAMMAFGWRVIEVTPQKWQAWLGIGKCGGDKNKLKAEAQRRFPEERVTLATADALLIYDYAQKKERGPK